MRSAAVMKRVLMPDRQMRLAHPGRTHQDDVLVALDEGEGRQLLDGGLRDAAGELVVEFVERLDRGEAGKACHRRSGATVASGLLRREYSLEEIGEALAFVDGILGERRIVLGDGAEAQLLAENSDAFVLEVHQAASRSSS
jgi:hypothetical protein